MTLYARLTEYALPGRKLLGSPAGWLDGAQVKARVEAAAAAFEACGIRRGTPVALRAHRTADTILAILGLEVLGAVAILTDSRQAPQAFLAATAPEIPAEFALDGEKLTDLTTGAVHSLDIPALEHKIPQNIAQDPDGPGFIIFTSGSTGKSKAVVLSQNAMIGNLLDAQPLGDYRADDIALGALPLDHVFGLVLLCGICVLGYGLYLPADTRISTLLEAIQKEKITRMNGVPSLYQALAAQKEGYDLGSLRAGFIGGGPSTPEAFIATEKALGMTLVSAYGMSECVGITSCSHLDPLEKRATTVGPFYARNTGKILLEDGSEAPAGVEGEICVHGAARMLGYYGDPQPQTGLLHTGDLGWLDEEGFVHISGRKKDIIIRNGLNLSPRPIEEALLRLPGITDAAVVGIPEPQAGEVPAAMVVGENPDALALLGAQLPKNQLPVRILSVPALPRTAAGKPDKQKIREVLAKWN